jgi:hypothetical protein
MVRQTEEKMEHRRIASFGVYFLLVAGTPALAAASGEQSAKGPYRGSYVCQAKLGLRGFYWSPVSAVFDCSMRNRRQ